MASNQSTGAEAMVRLLAGHGVRHIFGLCGDTSLPFYDALARLDHGMTHVLTRDERHAAYMADAYARLTHRVGICEGPSGGGATYIAPGLVEANESSVPILAITSDVATTSAGRYPLTELDQGALFRPLTKWNGVLDQAAALPRQVRRAFREMTTGRPGSAHLSLPFDVQKAPVPEEEIWADPRFGTLSGPACSSRPGRGRAAGRVAAGGRAPRHHLRRRRRAGRRRGGARPSSPSGSRSRWPPPSAARAPSPRRIRLPSASSARMAAGRRRAPSSTPPTASSSSAAAPARSRPSAGARLPPGTTILHLDNDPGVLGASYATRAALLADARLGLAAVNAALDGVRPRRFDGARIAAEARAGKEAGFRPLADSRPSARSGPSASSTR